MSSILHVLLLLLIKFVFFEVGFKNVLQTLFSMHKLVVSSNPSINKRKIKQEQWEIVQP